VFTSHLTELVGVSLFLI